MFTNKGIAVWVWGLPVAVLAVLLFSAAPAKAQESPAEEAIRVCTKCHDELEKYPVLSIFKTKHAVMADKRTPFADEACITCHGKSEEHWKDKPVKEEDRLPPDIDFRSKSPTPVAVKNNVCLGCHQGGKRIHWDRSAHSGAELACSTCHQVHTDHDKVRDKLTQTEVCFTCHKDKRAKMRRPSRHPILEGKVACSDCHNPHGSAGPKLLVRDNVNDTCYQCHMEKRGPFLRTHEPVQENCTLCHDPHGSTNPNLLAIRPPFLCQSCHQPSSHHSTIPESTVTTAGSPSLANAVIMARGCLNCHTNIHGSNNASDVGGRGFRR